MTVTDRIEMPEGAAANGNTVIHGGHETVIVNELRLGSG